MDLTNSRHIEQNLSVPSESAKARVHCTYVVASLNRSSIPLVLNITGQLKTSKGSFIWYVRKIFRKTDISYPLIRMRICAYQGVRNNTFYENFAYVLNDWSQSSSISQFLKIAIRIELNFNSSGKLLCNYKQWTKILLL